MSSRQEQVANKKGQILSKILRVNSAPKTSVIDKIKDRIQNPLFKLSIADYELMCGNKMLLNIMAKTLNCEVIQLKKFCKYINIFKENIDLSAKSIKKKMKPTSSLSQLPDKILSKIVDKYKDLFNAKKYVLRNWIPLNELVWNSLCKNPNAGDFLKMHTDEIFWDILCKNPSAIELLKEKIEEEKDFDEDELIDLEGEDKINWRFLSENPNAIKLLEENLENIDWKILSGNRNAIKLLKAYPKKIDWRFLSSNTNPEAIELLKTKFEQIDWKILSENPAAIELLKANQSKIIWKSLSLNTNPEAIKLLKANEDNIDWDFLSRNPNAIELLKQNESKINWTYLSENPNAVDLLIQNPKRIDWKALSKNTNPKVIELLKEKDYKINWVYLSANPIIFEEESEHSSLEKYEKNNIIIDSFAKIQDIIYIPINTEAKNKELIKSLFSKPIKYEVGLDKLRIYFENTNIIDNIYINYYHNILNEINEIIRDILYKNTSNTNKLSSSLYNWKLNYTYNPFKLPYGYSDIDTIDAIAITKQTLNEMWEKFIYTNDQDPRIGEFKNKANDELYKIILYSENNKNEQDIIRNLEINKYKYLAYQFILVVIRNNNTRHIDTLRIINKDIIIFDALITKNIIFNNDNSISLSKSISWTGTPKSDKDDFQAKANIEKYKVTKAALLKDILENNLNDSDPFSGEEFESMPLGKLKKIISIKSVIDGTTYKHAFYVKDLYKLWRVAEKSPNKKIKFINPYNRVPFTENDKKAIMEAMLTMYPKIERPKIGNGRIDISYHLATDGYTYGHLNFHYILKVPNSEDLLFKLSSIYIYFNLDYMNDIDAAYIPNTLFDNIRYLVENKKLFGKNMPIKILNVLNEYNDKRINTFEMYKDFFDKIKNAL